MIAVDERQSRPDTKFSEIEFSLKARQPVFIFFYAVTQLIWA